MQSQPREAGNKGDGTKTARYRLPYPPSVNNYYLTRIFPGGSRSTTRAPWVKKYVDDALWILMQQKAPRLDAKRIRLEIYVYPPDTRKRDLDNLCKAILDTLEAYGMYSDDFMIQQLYLERCEKRTGGLIEFSIWDLANGDFQQAIDPEAFNLSP